MALTCRHCGRSIADDCRRCPHCLRSQHGPMIAEADSRLRQIWLQERQAMLVWLRQTSPWPRIPILLFMLYLAWTTSFAPGSENIFWGINLGIHEAGHLLTSWAPRLVCAAAGSIAQCLAPVIAAILFRRQGDFFAISFCSSWLGTNCNYVAWYAADARSLRHQLVTVGGGGPPIPKEDMHDWHVILDTFGLLAFDGVVAGAFLLVGFLILWGGVALGSWQVAYQFRHR